MDDTQSTDVGGSPSATLPESTGDAAPSVSNEESVSQASASGDVTAQPAAQGDTSTQEGATPPPADEVDPLEGLPSADELQAQVANKVPYAEAVVRLRTALEARNSELGSLKPLEAFKDITQLGEPQTIKSRLEAYNSLFTPVVNPETQQPELDQHGFPKITTAPFIEQVDGENPGLAEQMLNDLLRYAPDNGQGQKEPLWQGMLKAWGLDPNRLEDYRNIDALAAPSTGEVTPEQLAAIDPKFHEAFKSFTAEQREDLIAAAPLAREGYLQDRAEALANKAFREQQAQKDAETQQQNLAAAREHITKEQDAYVTSQLQESYATIMDDVARQVTFSADPNENSQMLGITGATIFALRDPDFAAQAEKMLSAFGAKLDPSFHETLSVADKHMRDYKTYELVGQKGLAQNSLTKANAAKTQVLAKLAPLAVKIAKALGGQQAQRGSQQNGLLNQATTIRPTPGNGGTQAESNGYGIPGMLPNDPQFGVALARQTGLLSR